MTYGSACYGVSSYGGASVIIVFIVDNRYQWIINAVVESNTFQICPIVNIECAVDVLLELPTTTSIVLIPTITENQFVDSVQLNIPVCYEVILYDITSR